MAGRQHSNSHDKRVRPGRFARSHLLDGLESRVLLDGATTYGVASLTAFTGNAGGSRPSSVIEDASGNLFGITQSGGTHNYGTIYEVPANTNQIVTLATFNGANGFTPVGNLVLDAGGNLWGVTANGGAHGKGTIWELTAGSNTLIDAYDFVGGTQGSHPTTGIVMDASGNFWGTTYGSQKNLPTVFKFNPASSTLTSVATFDKDVHPNTTVAIDGNTSIANPTGSSHNQAAIVSIGGSDWVFVGVIGPGTNNGRGAIYGVNLDTGKATRAGDFNSDNTARGVAPIGSLYYFSDVTSNGSLGALLGQATYGGGNGAGVLFQATLGTKTGPGNTTLAAASISNVHGFNKTNGTHPTGELFLQGSAGNLTLYGATARGGKNGAGVVYEASNIVLGDINNPQNSTLVNVLSAPLSNLTGSNPLGGIAPILDGTQTLSGFHLTVASQAANKNGAIHGAVIELLPNATTPEKVVFSGQPKSAIAGDGIGALTLRVTRANGATDTSFNGDLTLSIATGPSGSALSGSVTLTVTAANGIAHVPAGILIDQAGVYSLAASGTSSGTAAAGQSAAFTIRPAAAAQLVVAQQPTTGTADTALSSIVIDVADAFGNVVTTNTRVLLQIVSGPAGGVIAGNSVSARHGVATFSKVKPSAAGTYSLQATAGSLTLAPLNDIVVT